MRRENAGRLTIYCDHRFIIEKSEKHSYIIILKHILVQLHGSKVLLRRTVHMHLSNLSLSKNVIVHLMLQTK